MARRCELTGKQVAVGNNVSHSNRKTRRRFLPNLRTARLTSQALGQTFTFKLSMSALRTVDHRGGLDGFLLKAKDSELSEKALKVKRDVRRAVQSDAQAPAPTEAA